MITLLVKHPDGAEREHPLEGELSIGRAEGNDVILVAGGVSRRHARLYLQDGEVFVEDVGSANGTVVDGKRIGEPSRLSPESELVIGDYRLRIKEEAAPGPRPKPARGAASRQMLGPPGPLTRTLPRQPPTGGAPSRPPRGRLPAGKAVAGSGKELARSEEPEASGPSLRGLMGPWANKVFPIHQRLLVGRVPGVDVQLEDESVSRRHAELSRGPEGVTLRDLGSANGTLVNGEPVSGPVLLCPGDIIQFGVVEVAFEAPESLAAPSRRGAGGGPASPGPGLSRGGKGLVAVFAVLILVVVGALYHLIRAAPPPPAGAEGNTDQPIGRMDPQAELQEHLNLCRSYTSSDLGEPDWYKAELACNKALDIDPINTEASSLMRRIKVEQENHDHYQKGDKAMLRLQEEEALVEFGEIKPGSEYYLKAKPRLREAIAGVLKKTAEDCKRYTREGEWISALPRCEKYMTLACQNMNRDDLVPPPGYSIRLTNGRLRKDEWRPKDAMYRLFLQARERVEPHALPWECPRIEVVQRDAVGPDIDGEVLAALQKRYPERVLHESLFNYWKGRLDESVLAFQKLRENIQRAELHATADELRKGVSQVEALFKVGQAALQQEDPIRAAVPFTEALELDAKLMQELAEAKPSWIRRSIQQGISEGAYKSGKFWADRRDFRKACNIWKTGFGFYRANLDLSRAILFCTSRGQEALQTAVRCDDLEKAAELAVDGDGLKEKIEARKQELRCPGAAEPGPSPR